VATPKIDRELTHLATPEAVEEPAAPSEPPYEHTVEVAPEPVAAAHESEPTDNAPAAVDQATPVAPAEPAPPAESNKKWYVVKVQSNREDSIKAAIERKVKIEGLEEFYGQIAIPAEEYVEKKKVKAKVKDKKTGNIETVYQEKNVIKYRKKFPGYLFAEVEFNDRILYLFRETSGVGDFVGGAGPLKPPPPMTDREVQQMLTGVTGREGTPGKKVAVKLDYAQGDKVRIKDGAFSGSEAEVLAIEMPKDPTDTPKVKVVVTMWGRQVPIDLDYWHVDKI
jgi:transcriptional antiterminator NusG